jgi:hypothetical protein
MPQQAVDRSIVEHVFFQAVGKIDVVLVAGLGTIDLIAKPKDLFSQRIRVGLYDFEVLSKHCRDRCQVCLPGCVAPFCPMANSGRPMLLTGLGG